MKLLFLQSWFEANQSDLQQKGFLLSYQQASEHQTVKTNIISVEKGSYEASVTLWETGYCDFLAVNMNASNTDSLQSATSYTSEIFVDEIELTTALTKFFDDLQRLDGS